MTDPAYAIEDTYAGPDGDEWVTRWSMALNRPLPWASFPEPPADIQAADKRLDTDPEPAFAPAAGGKMEATHHLQNEHHYR